MRTKKNFGVELLFAFLLLALLMIPSQATNRIPVGPGSVFDTPLPVMIASIIYCAVVGVGKVMEDG